MVPCGNSQHLWLVLIDDVYQRFRCLNHTTSSLLPTALVLAVATAPHGLMTSPKAEATLSRRLRTLSAPFGGGDLPDSARSGRIPVAEYGVTSRTYSVVTNAITTSCRTPGSNGPLPARRPLRTGYERFPILPAQASQTPLGRTRSQL
jgi:hypothetical protein